MKYDGITGITTPQEARDVVRLVAALGPNREVGVEQRPLMLGVLASKKTLWEGGNSKPLRYPKPAEIGPIFDAAFEASEEHGVDKLLLLHYATSTTDAGALRDELEAVHRIAGASCDGFQLNLSWPAPAALIAYNVRHRRRALVLQINIAGVAQVGHDPQTLVAELASYQDVLSAILIDWIAGRGVALAMETHRLREMIARVQRDLPRLGVGIAGRLCAETFSTVATFLPGCSTDTESRMRDDAPGGGHLVLTNVEAHLRALDVALR